MKNIINKSYFCRFLMLSALFAAEFYNVDSVLGEVDDNSQKDTPQSSSYSVSASDFQPLGEPSRLITGAYYGVGIGISRISHKVKVEKNLGANNIVNTNNKHTATQFDVSLIGGFGTALYEKYYVGIEFDFFKRLPKKTTWFGGNASDVGVVHKPSIGLNMDIRFGYQFPQNGTLIYTTVGFARVIGEMQARINNDSKIVKASFGSFFPTVGLGVEHRINSNLNARVDARFSIGSKEKKTIEINGRNWNFEGKPNRFAIRLSLTRNV